ncbi:unnamed protein product [Rhizoctonia solani]|uniref:Cellulase n=1 Tax=Rhizoctonia solani TaxID=456999 RepID=A0A8H2WWM5_9AGAM|nr:unnamed protein product [Rhizoctonia solani]
MKFAVSLAAVLFSSLTLVNAQSGTGATTRYWDCCKGSCGWSGKASVSAPIRSCDKSNNPLSDYNAQSGCGGGPAYACSNNSPWAVNDSLAYGFAAVKLQGGTESSWCCQCYELTFTSGPNHFDLMIPGGGVGIFGQGCATQYGAPSNGWGNQYGGVSSRSECSQLPSALQAGCYWRFDWFKGADNPSVNPSTLRD